MSSSSGEVSTPGALQPVGEAGDLSRFNPFDPAILAQPWEYNDRLVAEAPVHREPNTGLILVSSYELVNQVLNLLLEAFAFPLTLDIVLGDERGTFQFLNRALTSNCPIFTRACRD